MNKVLIIIILWFEFGFITPFSFAAEISGVAERVTKVETKKPVNPNPTLAPEKNCDNCSESQQIKTEIKSSPTPTLPGVEVKGVQNTPKPSEKLTIKPIAKPVIDPSPLPSPSASISASPLVQPALKPAEEKQTSATIKIWNWILGLFMKKNP